MVRVQDLLENLHFGEVQLFGHGRPNFVGTHRARHGVRLYRAEVAADQTGVVGGQVRPELQRQRPYQHGRRRGYEGLGRKYFKVLEALEKVKSLGLPRCELAGIAREVDITYGIEGLGRKDLKGLEVLEKVRSLSLPEGQLARIAPEAVLSIASKLLAKKKLKFLEALEKVRSWGLL